MTNKEKFKEIFGIEPDCGRCNPYPCEENDCKYWAECENQPGCACDGWWDWEFEESATKNDLGVDCISREVVERIINKWLSHSDYELKDHIYSMTEKIHNLPSVISQEPRWTPVSERLPEKNMSCLVSVGKFHFTDIAMYSDLMETIDHKIFWQGDYGKNNFRNITKYVCAWMPLPRDYREVKD